MVRMRRALLAGFVLWTVAPVIALVGWMAADVAGVPSEQDRIEQYTALIASHEPELLDALRQAEAGGCAVPDGVRSVVSRGDVVEFHMHGSGLGSATNYYGFYYSPQDVPLGAMGMGPYAAAGDRWVWDPPGDNRGCTFRLMPNWFYFEAHF